VYGRYRCFYPCRHSGARANLGEETAIATKTLEDRKEALNLKTLGKRANITLCNHGINKKYCKPCSEKKPLKSKKSAAVVEETPAAE
jgi:hypothetical protein